VNAYLDFNANSIAIASKQGGNLMAEDATGGIGQADDIENQINQGLQEIEQIHNILQVITAPDGWRLANARSFRQLINLLLDVNHSPYFFKIGNYGQIKYFNDQR
jgi:hypothetical protein